MFLIVDNLGNKYICLKGAREGIRFSVAIVTGRCEPPKMSTWNQTLILSNSSKYS